MAGYQISHKQRPIRHIIYFLCNISNLYNTSRVAWPIHFSISTTYHPQYISHIQHNTTLYHNKHSHTIPPTTKPLLPQLTPTPIRLPPPLLAPRIPQDNILSISLPHTSTPSLVRTLQQYVEVDIYGKCGSLKCQRSQQRECYRMLERDYKFYLAFENSLCADYVTEKFFGVLQ